MRCSGTTRAGTLARLLALDDRARAGRLVVMNTEMPGHRPPWIPLYQRLAALPFTATSFGWLLRIPAYRRSNLGYGPCFEDPSRLDDDFHACFVTPLAHVERRIDGSDCAICAASTGTDSGRLATRHDRAHQGRA
jgi:hypothetical protein